MLLINPYRFAAPRSSDADANAYILAVESADGQQLEEGVISAVESFILGCKSDGIWSALKASCILAGARTLSGALMPLVGTAPTNNNFVTADYNRKTGIKGDGSTKYLNPNRNNNADPQNSKHLAVYATEITTISGTSSWYIGGSASAGRSSILNFNGLRLNVNSSTFAAANHAAGLIATTRTNSSAFQTYGNKITNGNGVTTLAATSSAPANFIPHIFKRHDGTNFSNPRLSYYSIGEHLDLALLDTRVSNLMTALASAIP